MAHTRSRIVGLLINLSLLGACKMGVPESEIMARVNDEPVLKKDFQTLVDHNMARYRGQAQALPPGIEARIQESVLRRMIDDEIVAQKAKALQVELNEPEIAAKFKEHKERFRSDQAFEDYLKRSNNTEAALKDDLRRSMLRDKVVEKLTGAIEVTDADVRKYYDDNAARFHEPEQVKARRIVVRLPQPATPADKVKKKKEADKLHEQAVKPGADFGKLAREHSEGPEAAHDGEMGGLFARGHMPPDFDAIAFALQPNEVSKVVETKLGYEIVQIVDKKADKQKPFEEAKDTIRPALLTRLRNDKRRDVLRDLKTQAKVEVLAKFDTNPPAPAAPGSPTPSPVGGVPSPAPAPTAPHGAGGAPPPPPPGTPPPGIPPPGTPPPLPPGTPPAAALPPPAAAPPH